MTDRPGRVTAALLFLVLLFCIYRARTQSLTIDEAWVFKRFVNQPLSEMTRSWDACNHVLHTVLMKWFRDAFGIAEIVLRLPTLIGAALYLSAVHQLTGLIFSGWRQPLAAALLVLHPLVTDHMVAARGYGLALGLFAWALYCAVSFCVRGRELRWLSRAGIFAGLSVAANLAFAIPVAALGVSLLLMEYSTRSRADVDAVSFWRTVDSYFGPALVVSALIVVLPVLQAQASDFYFGVSNPLDTLRRMFDSILKSDRAAFTPYGWYLSRFAGPALILLFVGISGVTGLSLLRGRHRHYANAPLTLTGATLVVTALLHSIAGAFGVPFPFGRTGLYLIPLFTLSTILLFQRYRPAAIAGILIVFIYVSENDPRYFVEWRYDAGTRDLLRRLDEDRSHRNSPERVRVAVVPPLTLTAEYYRLRRRTAWMQIAPPDSSDAEYLLVDFQNAARARSPQYEIIGSDALSGAILARRNQ